MSHPLQARFIQLPRSERERVLCAMIRVNYATTWPGDADLLRSFLPFNEHDKVAEGRLDSLISLLTLYAEEPTEPGYKFRSTPGDVPVDAIVTEKNIPISELSQQAQIAELPATAAVRHS